MALQAIRKPHTLLSLLRFAQTLRIPHGNNYLSTTIDVIDAFSSEIVQKHRTNPKGSQFENLFSIRYYMDSDNDKPINTKEDLDTVLQNLLLKNKDKQIENFVADCVEKRIFINSPTLKKLFRYYSAAGRPDVVAKLQNYCQKVDPNLYRRNGEFLHFLAKAQCMKGNSEKGLSALHQGYQKYESLRSLYRLILKDLINDSVLNRSEATLVIFKKYLLEFSDKWDDHYPLICFWHQCWGSNWFSDQMLANDLLDSSPALQEIVRDKATAFSIQALRDEFNEDAVVRLLQSLLKYKLLTEYTKVLQILFGYKMRNHDLRGCTEIIRNCKALGITLPSYQQGKYIKMLIRNNQDKKKPESKEFKLKF